MGCQMSRSISKAAIAVVLLWSASAGATASDIWQDFDSLGGNKILLDKAQALYPEVAVNVVQKRIVSRRKRFEIAGDASYVLGGDAYLLTRNGGVVSRYHITPRWSVGGRFNASSSSLRDEAGYLSEQMPGFSPAIDYPRNQVLVVADWYPIYGKMNLYELGIAHFDVYATVGFGRITLDSGQYNTATAGGGIGVWLSQHVALRTEVRWQGYPAKRAGEDVYMNTTVMGIQLGWLI